MDKKHLALFIALPLVLAFIVYFLPKTGIFSLTTWQEADLNNDGTINSLDIESAISFTHCPVFGDCSTTVSPTPTPPSSDGYVSCADSSFGTMLVLTSSGLSPGDVILNINSLYGVKGMVAAGAPSPDIRDTYFSKLDGWDRSFIAGTLEQLSNKTTTAKTFNMENMYECLSYGPESEHSAGDEALFPTVNVPKAKEIAAQAGKCLVYGPAVRDYDTAGRITQNATDDEIASVISQVAPSVDVWMVQLGKYQPMVDSGRDYIGDPYGWTQFDAWMKKWVSWIKGSNPQTDVWIQLGIGVHNPLTGKCEEPQSSEYLIEWRNHLAADGVDGMFIMPAQPCQPCPENPPLGFICSTDPQDHYYYEQALKNFQEAVATVCQ